jgi:hypothetical protein
MLCPYKIRLYTMYSTCYQAEPGNTDPEALPRNYTCSQALPGNADPEALPHNLLPFATRARASRYGFPGRAGNQLYSPREAEPLDMGSQAEQGNQVYNQVIKHSFSQLNPQRLMLVELA